MQIDTAGKAIDLFVHLAEGASELELVFTGGEPLLAQETLTFLLKRATELCLTSGMRPRFILKTNGTIMTDDLIPRLRASSVRAVVSIDGQAAFHNTSRLSNQGESTHALVLGNLLRLQNQGVECVASMTVIPEFAGKIAENVRYLLDNGIYRIDVGPAYGTVIWQPEQVKLLTDSFLEIAEIQREGSIDGRNLVIGPLYRDSDHHGGILADTWGCHAGSSHLAFLPDGQIAGCSSLAMLSQVFPNLILGNLNKGIDQNSLDVFQRLTHAPISKRPACITCDTAANCSGGCIAINLSDTGKPNVPPAFYCDCIGVLPKALSLAWGES